MTTSNPSGRRSKALGPAAGILLQPGPGAGILLQPGPAEAGQEKQPEEQGDEECYLGLGTWADHQQSWNPGYQQLGLGT